MNIIKTGILAVALLFSSSAMAASIPNIKFDNGQTTTSCTAGQTVNVTFRVNVPAGEVAELGQVDVLGDSLAPALPAELGGELGLQEGLNDVNTSVMCPQNTGYYTVEYKTAGIFGGVRAITMTDGVTSTASFTSAIRVVANGGATTGGTSDVPSWFSSMMSQLIAALKPAPVVTPPAPVVNTACTTLATKMVGTMPNVYNDANIKLQGFLLSEGMSIPALAAGASFGFYGPQSAGALAQFKVLKGCS